MLVVLPFSANDVRQAIDLLDWIKLLGGAEKYKCLLVADAAVGWVDGMAVKEAADKVFPRVEIITNEASVGGWPEGANSLFFTAAKHIKDDCWLWLEPDCVPLHADWLERIDDDYIISNAPFMGHVYENSKPEFPRKLMSGIAVYPPDTTTRLFEVQSVAWDMHHADLIVPRAARTNLIYHFYGEKDLPPTFVEFRGPNDPVNAMVLENIPKEAVLYHRNKDGTLLNLLKRKQFPHLIPQTGPLLAVIAFCGKDVELCKRNMEWIVELGGVKSFPCLLSYDDYTQRTHVSEIRKLAEQAFAEVKINAYRARTDLGWPSGANLAFQNTAAFVQQNYKLPWLFLEADAVPMKSTWLDEITTAYYRSGKSFFGPIVPERGHMNGVCVYPWNAANRLPRAMSASNLAWDYVCFPDMQHDHADAEPIIQHVWGWHENRAHPHAGDAMRFNSIDEVNRWVKPKAVLFHRAKDGSLIARLREMKRL